MVPPRSRAYGKLVPMMGERQTPRARALAALEVPALLAVPTAMVALALAGVPATAGLTLAVALLAVGLMLASFEASRPALRQLMPTVVLAAVAAAGRVLFSPIPDVKPVSAVAIVAGAALGRRSGFAVGAVAALVSNFFFGQGPWTPWQMYAWGLVGYVGGPRLRPAAHLAGGGARMRGVAAARRDARCCHCRVSRCDLAAVGPRDPARRGQVRVVAFCSARADALRVRALHASGNPLMSAKRGGARPGIRSCRRRVRRSTRRWPQGRDVFPVGACERAVLLSLIDAKSSVPPGHPAEKWRF